MIGFVESRLTTFVQQLESDLKLFDGVLIDSQSPYHTHLSSTIVIALPFQGREKAEFYKEVIARAFSLFEWRLETSGDVSDWKNNHASVYHYGTFEELPPIVI